LPLEENSAVKAFAGGETLIYFVNSVYVIYLHES